MSDPANPLVAPRVDSTTWYSGVGIAETVEMTVEGIHGGSWIDITLGGVGTAVETAVWVLDPIGALVAAGFGYAVEHLQPLSDVLDWLAGDPDQVNANANTWRNVATEHADIADLYVRAIRHQVPDWQGQAADAYRHQAGHTIVMLGALGKAAEGMAAIVAMTGSLVHLVRTLVRDLIGELVSILLVRIPLWTLETVGTFGIASPYVAAQITALVAKWGARIARLLRALARSLRNLMPAISTLDEAMTAVGALLRQRSASGQTGPLFLTPGRSTDAMQAGAGGVWRTIDETPGGAVAQHNDLSCVSATGEMLSGRPQAGLIDAIGSPSSAGALADELGPQWRGGQVGYDPRSIEALNKVAPWGAELFDGANGIGHMVVVDGVRADGRLLVRDPWGGGSTYAMDLDEFRRVWNGNAVFKP